MVEIDFLPYKISTEIPARDYARADLPPPRSSAAMVAAAADGSGDSNGRPVTPHQGTVTPSKFRKRKSKPRDRAKSGSPDSTVTTAAATLRGGDGVDQELVTTAEASSRGGNDGAEELRQQTNGKKPRLVWTTELHDKFVRACKSLGRDKAVPKNILKSMNVDGLTRENVASHLQKYRQNLEGRGQATRRRGKGGAMIMMHHIAPSLQPDFPQSQPTEPAFPQAPSPSPSANPALPPQGPFAAANMSHPQIGHGHGQMVQALQILVHQPHEDFPVVLAPMPQLFYPPPPQLQAAIERRKMIMEQQAQHAAAARMKRQVAVAPGHINHHPVAMNYELGAQTLARAPPAVASGVQSHRLQPHMQVSRDVNMSGGLYCPVPEASTRDEQTEAHMGMAQLQIAVEAEAGQVPAAEPAFAGSAGPENGGQQEDSCGVLRFWNTASAPSMDHEFPPKNQPDTHGG